MCNGQATVKEVQTVGLRFWPLATFFPFPFPLFAFFAGPEVAAAVAYVK